MRGVAVLGILFANIVAFSQVHLAYSWPGALAKPMDRADTAVWLVQFLLIDGKMRGLFSLLFGAGMVLFMDRAWARGESLWLQLRRLLWLGAFGLAHFLFLFWGDILFLYAEAGILALPFVRLEARPLIAIGLGWYALGALLVAEPYIGVVELEGSVAAQLAAPADHRVIEADLARKLADARAERAAFGAGSYRAELEFVATHRAPDLLRFPWFALLETVPLMLIGMGLYRYGLFSGAVAPAVLRRWGWRGLAAGTALSLPLALWALARHFPPFLSLFVADDAAQLPHLLAILGYAALLAGWAPRAADTWLGERLIAAGRMAFSNYIGTSLVMMLVFRSWAGGLYGTLGRTELLVAVVLGWGLMLRWSKPWLQKYRYGPLEWLWRCLTYGRIFPLRRAALK
ncbi:MAG: DUF418 domain-containing protein [Candidatus Andeanibacterium colombiense]|uniref:DUF418 domain-containing protein n=1 Tax=Candidatus Andeanibacterium colombiense TaxID=3121345 RepID=A0AAJ5X7K5_9SPHN|nr:MAG: DUF418 domain-containing protein [Sphingomonadaceae bacterium]